MIFGTGLFLFIIALVLTFAIKPEKAGLVVSTMGCFGCALMLASLCMLLARVLP